MNDHIPASRQALDEALNLSEEILKDIELNRIPLTNIALKTSRLARLLNDSDTEKIMQYEAGGYPLGPQRKLSQETGRLAVAAGREFAQRDRGMEPYVYCAPIVVLEDDVEVHKARRLAATDASDLAPGVEWEGMSKYSTMLQASTRLASRRTLIHRYVLRTYYELKFSGIAEDVFARIRQRVDSVIGRVVPDAVRKFTAAYDYLASENPEDWSNAVHSCRRVLEDLADAVYPPTDDKTKVIDGKKKTIKLGKEHYINRMCAFVEDRSTSETFKAIVGSHLRFLGDRLDSICKATQKASHTTLSREEAERYVVYTYMLVGDILSLYEPPPEEPALAQPTDLEVAQPSE